MWEEGHVEAGRPNFFRVGSPDHFHHRTLEIKELHHPSRKSDAVACSASAARVSADPRSGAPKAPTASERRPASAPTCSIPTNPSLPRASASNCHNPPDDTRLITKAATDGLQQAYREGFAFSKAEALLLDLRQPGKFTGDLFAPVQPERTTKAVAVMDSINACRGSGTVRPGSVPAEPDWGMRRALMSNRSTTRRDHLWSVR